LPDGKQKLEFKLSDAAYMFKSSNGKVKRMSVIGVKLQAKTVVSMAVARLLGSLYRRGGV